MGAFRLDGDGRFGLGQCLPCSRCGYRQRDVDRHDGVGVVHDRGGNRGAVADAQEAGRVAADHQRLRGCDVGLRCRGEHLPVVGQGAQEPGGVRVGHGVFRRQRPVRLCREHRAEERQGDFRRSVSLGAFLRLIPGSGFGSRLFDNFLIATKVCGGSRCHGGGCHLLLVGNHGVV